MATVGALLRPASRSVVAPVALVLGFAAAVAVRLGTGGVAVRDSAPAGLIFAAALMFLAVIGGTRGGSAAISRTNAVLLGVVGAAVLCAPVVAAQLMTNTAHHRPAGNYATWAVVVSLVALAEEAFLRGALYAHVERAAGSVPAVLVTAVCFAALHVPLYGWRAGLLDLAVGLWLGALRYLSGTWIAPGVAHVAADLAGWWLR